jgi:hypothetical protein
VSGTATPGEYEVDDSMEVDDAPVINREIITCESAHQRTRFLSEPYCSQQTTPPPHRPLFSRPRSTAISQGCTPRTLTRVQSCATRASRCGMSCAIL